MTIPKARITVEVERHLFRKVKAKAALQGKTISDVVRAALTRFLEDEAAFFFATSEENDDPAAAG